MHDPATRIVHLLTPALHPSIPLWLHRPSTPPESMHAINHPAVARPVPADFPNACYVIRHRRDRDAGMFGVHPLGRDGLYSTHVLAFRDLNHARAMAKGLESFRTVHGAFPRRDMAISDMRLSDIVMNVPIDHLSVDAVRADDLVDELRGSGMMLAMCTPCGKAAQPTWTFIRCAGDPRMALTKAWYAAKERTRRRRSVLGEVLAGVLFKILIAFEMVVAALLLPALL